MYGIYKSNKPSLIKKTLFEVKHCKIETVFILRSFLSEKECISCHEWDILEEKLEVEYVDCVTKHMDVDIQNRTSPTKTKRF